jgi:hypothetical protein
VTLEATSNIRRSGSTAERRDGRWLVREAVFGNEDAKTRARWLLWEIGQHAGRPRRVDSRAVRGTRTR